MLDAAINGDDFVTGAVSPFLEMGAYEALWCEKGATFKRMAERFAQCRDCLPSRFVDPDVAYKHAQFVTDAFEKAGVRGYGVQIHGAGEYPLKLRDARYPVELIYHQGWLDLVHSPAVAVVGTRKPSDAGLKRTEKLVRLLARDNFTVVSGLAAGIDRKAHETAIEAGGLTFAVIGTPLSESYPKENAELQRRLAEDFLVVSQVPVQHHGRQDYRSNRAFFPERNVTMSALTDATVIVEASDTSGSLHQARAALQQNRKLFILDNCFVNPQFTWPARMEQKGAIRVREYDDILQHLSPPMDEDRRPATA